MRISWQDIDKYENPRKYKLVDDYNVYSFVFDCPNDMKSAGKQFNNLYARIVYDVKKDSNFNSAVFILGLSCHDGKNSFKCRQKSSSPKGGRPKQKVVGKTTKKHIHGYIALSKEIDGLYSLVKRIVDKEDKRQLKRGLKKGHFQRSSNKGNRNLCCMPIQYVRQQSEPNYYREYGDTSPFISD